MQIRNRLAATVAAAAILAASSATALAASPQDVADALTKLVQAGKAGATFTVGSSAEENGEIVFHDVAITTPEQEKTNIATLSLGKADVKADGSLSADRLTAKGVTANDKDGTIAIDTLELTNPVFPAGGKSSKVDSVAMETLTFTQTNEKPVTVASVGLDLGDYAGDVPHSIDLAVEGLVVDPKTVDEKAGSVASDITALGYDTIELNFYAAGNLDPKTEELSIDEITIDGTDMGTLTLSGVLGGLSDEVLKSLANSEPSFDALSKVTVKEAGLYYGDASLTGRIIAEQAKKAGEEPDALVNQLTGALPLVLMAIDNPDFQKMVTDAVTTFLKEPRNISITASPETPITLMDLVATAQTAPQTLPDMLKAEVQANQDDEDTDDGDDGSDGDQPDTSN